MQLQMGRGSLLAFFLLSFFPFRCSFFPFLKKKKKKTLLACFLSFLWMKEQGTKPPGRLLPADMGLLSFQACTFVNYPASNTKNNV